MAWQIRIDAKAQKDFAKLDKQVIKRIRKYLEEEVLGKHADNPRAIGEALKGKRLGEFWKYRIGDYRVIAKIEDTELVILVVKVGNRKEVYKVK